MKYPGKELEIFEKTIVFQNYTLLLVKNFMKGRILEVGAGIGGFTKHYHKRFNKVFLNDLDKSNVKKLKKRFNIFKNIKIIDQKTHQVKSKFETIMYINVLEHIKKDILEIKTAEKKLTKNGHLIIFVPAHQVLFSKFDKAVGHYRRYSLDFFKKNHSKNLVLKRLVYVDSVGYILYFLNKLFFSDQTYPSKFKVFLWDKVFCPLSILLDFISLQKFGKNILCVYQKK